MKVIDRLLIITPWFPTEPEPQNGTFILDHAQAWLKYFPKFQNHPIKIVVFHELFPLDYVNMVLRGRKLYRKVRTVAGIPVVHEQAARLSHRFSLCIESWQRQRRLQFGLQIALRFLGGQPNIVIAQTLSGLMTAMVGKNFEFFSCPVILIEHSNPLEMHMRTISRKKLAVEALDKVDQIIIVANRQLDDFAKYAPQKSIQRIWNPVADSFFSSSLKKRITNKKMTLRMVTVGHTNYEKAQERIIKALVHLPIKIIKQLDIVGGGSRLQELKFLAKELKLKDRVTFHGSISHESIVPILQDADVFVLSSRYENCPVALLEAQAMGLPCVVTQNNASEHVLLPGNGICVEQDETGESLAAGIRSVYDNFSSFNNQEIRQRALAHFSGEIFAKKCYQVFSELL